MILRVSRYGEPILRKKGQPVTVFDVDLGTFVKDLFDTMYAADGIGLAAQQVGHAKQVFVMDLTPPKGQHIDFSYQYDGKVTPLELFMPLAVINPNITISDPSSEVYEEGCLSFPGVNGNVTRPKGVRCDFQDAQGNVHRLEADGLLGRCMLHEMDHLNGVLFIDKMEKRHLQKNDARIKKLKRTSRDYLKSQ
jgi:peptide deformylase